MSLPVEPLLLADWLGLLMIHFEVDPVECRKLIPFELDLYQGHAWISVVAFTLKDMRPRLLGAPGAWLFKPIATHEFLNVRTYVKVGGEAGIYFLAEWLSNRLSALLGPLIFGLPYRFGKICYHHQASVGSGSLSGTVLSQEGKGMLSYNARLDSSGGFCPADPGSLDEWLMERYTAFTCFRSKSRFFRVWHEPYIQCQANVRIHDQRLLEMHWPIFRRARLASANFCPGVGNVWMGWPHSLARIKGSAGN
jgi:uncharacterized protein YqjF (DUF2071 family)